ncbi:MAG: hypothetical protein HUJ68_10620, partial [Clostridia bacterium]|nr:hypothetical protein [Clostridia bacterium]
MAYRYIEHKVEPRHRDTETLSSPCKIYLQNGSISDTAYPCWYLIEPRPKRLEFYT